MSEDQDGYEYKVVRVVPHKMERTLNRLARDGWEPIDIKKKGLMEWGSKSTVTLRRRLG